MEDCKQVDPVQEQLLIPSWASKWREGVAVAFIAIVTYDFLIAPLFVQVMDGVFHANLPLWVPNTTQGGGLFYVAMSVIIGVSAWGKGNEMRELIKNMPDHS